MRDIAKDFYKMALKNVKLLKDAREKDIERAVREIANMTAFSDNISEEIILQTETQQKRKRSSHYIENLTTSGINIEEKWMHEAIIRYDPLISREEEAQPAKKRAASGPLSWKQKASFK